MTTLKQYATQAYQRQQAIAIKLGSDIQALPKPCRATDQSLLALLAVVLKTLVDKGVITDADLLAAMDAAMNDTYQDLPINPPPQGTL